jgi:hypothetical protein
MKISLIITLMFAGISSFGQNKSKDGWTSIYFVLDNSGNEVAKRIHQDSATWSVDKPQFALEQMYKDKEAAEEKYKLALAILKQLNPNGTPVDQKKYNQAVSNYNQYLAKAK